MKKIRILIVDDSDVVRSILKEIFAQDDELEVVAEATNGKEAIEMTRELKPDLITMDIQMPEMDGFEATEKIMAYYPTPILIFSSALDTSEKYTSIKAISLGALDVLKKPELNKKNFFDLSKDIINKIKILSNINVIHHIKGKLKHLDNKDRKELKKSIEIKTKKIKSPIVAIGISTGGPVALEKLLSKFPKNFSAPIVIVQHITEGFLDVLIDILNQKSELNIKIAEHGEVLKNGIVYFAPDNHHMLINERMKVILDNDSPPWNEHKPSVNHLFNSIAENLKDRVIAVIMTGMGQDGKEGIIKIHNNKGITIAQSIETSLISSMPKSAISTGKIDYILDLEDIAEFITNKIVEI